MDGGVHTQECMRGNVKENFEHIKGYRAYCYGKNFLIKFKGGDLVPQQGATTSFWTKKKLSQGGGIDMKFEAGYSGSHAGFALVSSCCDSGGMGKCHHQCGEQYFRHCDKHNRDKLVTM